MIKKWKLTIPTLSGNTPRRAYVYVPNEAKRHPERRYPVLYMFDGHNVFYDSDATYGKSWGMKAYMDRTRTPVIIAAVECNHGANGERLSEYSPYSFYAPGFGDIVGRADETMDWMINTFKPMIDEMFPTIPDRECTWIGGSSMGGLISLYAVLNYNEVFSRAACLSPSLWFGKEHLNPFIKSAKVAPDTVIYMDYGSGEMKNHRGMRAQYKRVCGLLMDKRIHLTSRIVPNGTHCEASWESQIPFFMNTLIYEF